MLERRPLLLAFLGTSCLILACAAPALAAGTDDAARAAARSAGYDGIRAYQSGDYALAVDKLDRAYGVVRVPTLGLWYARALAKAGKLVEASERYQEVIRLELGEGRIKEQKKAQAEAADELEALQPRIPSLTITVVGVTEDTEILLDGKPVPQKLLGLATPANSGEHRVQARLGEETVEETVTLRESEKASVELKLKSSAARTKSGGSSDSGAEGEETTGSRDTDKASSAKESTGKTQKTLGWVSLGLGGVATVAGAVTGVLAISKRKKLDDSNFCRGTECLPEVDDTRKNYNRMLTATSVGLIVGAVGIGVGTTLLLTTPKPKKQEQVGVWVGIGSVGLKGAF